MNNTIGTRSVIQDANRRNVQIKIKRADEIYKFHKLYKRSAKRIQKVFRYFIVCKKNKDHQLWYSTSILTIKG